MRNYILEGHNPVPVDDFIVWARWMETHKYAIRANAENGWTDPVEDETRVGRTKIADSTVSTVFLGIDHGLGFGGPPILFETMVFGGDLNGEIDRYADWDSAEAGHREMCEQVREQASA